MGERVRRSIMNIKVGMLFYVLSLLLAFFSRKVFLDYLGAEFLGLTGMLMNILSFLSVAELGIGTSIVYFLYKPLQEDNHEKINEIMSMLAYLYRCIGLFMGACGIVISLFFPWWFGHLETDLLLVYFAFFSFLATAITGYVFNYRQLLISANQKQYVVNAYFQSINVLQSLTQILLVYFYKNLYLWVAVGLIFTIIACIVFNYRIRKEYPWLRINLKEGRRNLKTYPEVLKKTRQIFAQKIKDFILYRSDEILVGAFVSVVQVAYYGNYMIIVNKLNFLTNILSTGMNAGIGNLVAEGNMQNTMKVFWELTAVRFLITGIIIFGLLMFFQPFIACWLGEEYLLDELIVYLLIFNIFIYLSRGVVEIYRSACGLFQDVWTAWTELVLNISVTLCLAPFYGIVGMLLGKIISVFFIAIFWRPYFVFTKGLDQKVSSYWRGMLPYYLIFAVFAALAILLRYFVVEPLSTNLFYLMGWALLIFPLLIVIYLLVMFVLTRGMKYFIARKPAIYKVLTCYKRKTT